MNKRQDGGGQLLLKAMQKILRYMDEGVHIIDPEGRTVLYNPAMEKIEGLSADEVLEKPLLELFPELKLNGSTLLQALAEQTGIEQRKQSYLNLKNERIITQNTTFPVFDGEQLLGAVEIARNYTGVGELNEKIVDLQQELINPPKPRKKKPKTYTFDMLVGEHPCFKAAIDIAHRAAETDASVLIYGETGTGKELFAQSIHNASARSRNAIIAVNCGAMPEALLESILFGTTKGCYTGALDRPGLFEQAHQGTLFLDEINSMSPALQVKLLRALQENRIRRLGGLEDLEVNTRVIAASNQPLKPMLENGSFRRDLYYRLNVINIRIPTLTERREDIPLLTNYFFKVFNEKMSKDVWLLSDEVEELFMNYSWSGNIRELQNVIESSMVMVKDEHVLERKHLPGHFDMHSAADKDCPALSGSLQRALAAGLPVFIDELEAEIITKVLDENEGNISKTASLLGISRQNLQYKLKRLNEPL